MQRQLILVNFGFDDEKFLADLRRLTRRLSPILSQRLSAFVDQSLLWQMKVCVFICGNQ
jgi:hypothetical protein